MHGVSPVYLWRQQQQQQQQQRHGLRDRIFNTVWVQADIGMGSLAHLKR